MNPIVATAFLIAMTLVAGCATGPGPQARPYTAEETRQLALEALNRRGLSFDEYHRLKAQLQREQSQGYGFEGMGTVHAERREVTGDRQG